MANTLLQIKRSTTANSPVSLNIGELAYTYANGGKLFIGNTSGTGVIEIGGRYTVDTTIAAYDKANNAYTLAQAAGGTINTFGIISVGGTNIAADSNTDTLTFVSSNGISLVGDAATDTVNVGLTLTGVTAQAYTASETQTPSITVDAYGRVTALSLTTVTNAAAVAISANSYATSVGTSGNAYATEVGTAGNSYATSVGTSGNAYATAVGTAGNNYVNGTFVKLTSASQTITGDLSVVGSLTISGNTSYVNVSTYAVQDPLIYLAANNYTSDIVDIGFIANYNNGSANLHTGLFREHNNKEYYLFQGYNQEPVNNHIDPNANGFTIAVLNSDLRTSNITLAGSNLRTWLESINSYATAVGTSGNAYTVSVGTSGNAYALATATAVGTAGNSYATSVGTSGNAYALATATSIGTSGNAYALATATAVGTAGNSYATAVGTSANAYATAVGTAANTNAANATYLSTGTVPSARISGSYTGITGLGTVTVGTWNADTIKVPYGGTGVTSFTQNGILYGNTAGDLKVTSAGTEGQVLQASSTGVPQFGMLDGGTF